MLSNSSSRRAKLPVAGWLLWAVMPLTGRVLPFDTTLLLLIGDNNASCSLPLANTYDSDVS
jgi:hypothetical protein